MSKSEVHKICKDGFYKPYCSQDPKNGRFYIFDDNTHPVFKHGHSSSRKAWKDYLKVLNHEDKSFLVEN